MRDTGKRKEAIFLTALFACWLTFNGILLLGHELWRDEANVWLIARELSPAGLFREIKYQGHPCLWYLLVMPFAKAGFPFQTISVLSFLIMAAAAGIFVYKAPVSSASKLLVLASPVFSYFYPVVARNYCLIALLLLLLACFCEERRSRPWLYGLLLGLLVQADSIAIAPAGLISLMWLWESAGESLREKKVRPLLRAAGGLWIPLASFLLWILQFYQVSESPEYHFRILPAPELAAEIRNFCYVILTRLSGCGKRMDQLLIVLFLIAALAAAIRLGNIWPGLVTAGAFLFEILFSIMVYQLHIWHYIALCFVLLWFIWTGYGENTGSGKSSWRRCAQIGERTIRGRIITAGYLASEALIMLLSVLMFLSWNSEKESSNLSNALFGVYSDGKNTASYIRENIGREELIVSVNVSEASTVLAYLGEPYEFYFAGSGQPETYADYREGQSRSISYEELLSRLGEQFPEKEFFYLLESPGSCLEDAQEAEDKGLWELCYETKADTARGENYRLYRILLHPL